MASRESVEMKSRYENEVNYTVAHIGNGSKGILRTEEMRDIVIEKNNAVE
jgi:hypothetical protein